jgi:hypothetical protein
VSIKHKRLHLVSGLLRTWQYLALVIGLGTLPEKGFDTKVGYQTSLVCHFRSMSTVFRASGHSFFPTTAVLTRFSLLPPEDFSLHGHCAPIDSLLIHKWVALWEMKPTWYGAHICVTWNSRKVNTSQTGFDQWETLRQMNDSFCFDCPKWPFWRLAWEMEHLLVLDTEE